jgi:hypothetical protein
MRVFELTAHLQKISRASGRSATAAAAYRACTIIRCERESITHDYRRKGGLEASGVVLPALAPAWAADRSRLWNAAEMRERNGDRGLNARAFKAKAVPAREILFSFPAELSAAGREGVAHTVARHLADTHRVAADFAIHAPGKEGDQRNFHCHMMMSTRRLTAEGFGQKAREWQAYSVGSRTVSAFRAYLAGLLNEALAKEGHADAVHVEHRSHKTRGTGITPTRHQGVKRTNARRKEKLRERREWEKSARREQAERHGRDRVALKAGNDHATAARLRDLDRRERQAVDTVRAERNTERATEQAAKGLGRLFQVASGQAARADAERQQMTAERDRGAEQRIASLQESFRADRQATIDQVAREQRVMEEKQRSEDQQLERAVSMRADHDRHQEQQMRREEVQHTRDVERQLEQPQQDRSMGRDL